jgi:Mlc titration factor MtfA (ptsG expression regulator)
MAMVLVIFGSVAAIIAIGAIYGRLPLLDMHRGERAGEGNQVTAQDILRLESHLSDFIYYTRLSPLGRVRFMNRLVEFMLSKRWEGWEGIEVTEEMKVLISASATQLTFGMEHYVFPHFHTIRVYPKAYFFKLTGQYFKGGTSESGVISLSWKHFKEGYEDPSDRLNLGLHEWAHALKIDLASEDDFDSRFISYLENWESISYPEFSKMHEGEPSFLRAYAGTNMNEFFAVCIEHFFEVPAQFKVHLPVIYHHLGLLLNQDPANITNDYRLTGPDRHPKHTASSMDKSSIPLDVKKVKVIKQGFRAWPMYVVAAGLFLGTATLVWVKQHTVISTPLTLLYVLAFGVGGLIQWPYFRRRNMLEFRHFVMYSFCGSGLCASALMFLLNYLVPVEGPYEKVLRVESITHVNNGRYKIDIGNEEYNNVGPFSAFSTQALDVDERAKYVKLTLTRGVLGMEVLRGVEFVR